MTGLPYTVNFKHSELHKKLITFMNWYNLKNTTPKPRRHPKYYIITKLKLGELYLLLPMQSELLHATHITQCSLCKNQDVAKDISSGKLHLT